VPYLIAALFGAQHRVLERLAIAAPLACLGFSERGRGDALTGFLAPLNLGVYLAHMAVLEVLRRTPGFSELGALGVTASLYAASVLLVLGLRRARVPYLA
jgi:hypothetical protein